MENDERGYYTWQDFEWVYNLWAAVLERAILDCKSQSDSIYETTSTVASVRDIQGAKNWIRGSGDRFNSFNNVCRILNSEPDRVRKKIEETTIEKLRKIRSGRDGRRQFWDW